MKNANEVASTINCKNGSVRSLALNTKSVLEANGLGGIDPSRMAWDFAKSVKDEFGDYFSEEDARKHFTETFSSNGEDSTHKSKSSPEAKPISKTSDTTSKKDTPEFGRKANSILNDNALSKNEKIRQLLSLGHGISQIASTMGLSYQRIKNVVKNVKKAIENKANA